jgi:hypothetical protein
VWDERADERQAEVRFPSFSTDVQEDSWVSSPHCSQKVGSFAVRSVRGLRWEGDL